MIYAMSDLHGCYNLFKRMLKRIHFCDQDTLYILGDIVDRGAGGIQILLEIMGHSNIIPLLGNHDVMAYSLLKKLPLKKDLLDENVIEAFRLWFLDGGAKTFKGFQSLDKNKRNDVLMFFKTFKIYKELDINGRHFFLSHTVPEKERMLDLDSCNWEDFILGEPDYGQQYFYDRYIVTGHTPTGLIDKSFAGKIYQKHHHIAIDCGAVFGNPLGCICLDTLKTFYAE